MLHRVFLFLACLSLCVAHLNSACGQNTASAPVSVATVNGKPLTSEQLKLNFYLDQVPEEASPEVRAQLLEKLIDKELVRQFLQSRSVVADPVRLERQMATIQKVIGQQGEPLEVVLGKLKLTPQELKEVLSLPLAWDRYARSVLTDQQIQAEWESHRDELDGTRVHASQIVRTLKADSPEEKWQAAEKLLSQLREEITAGKLTFADAAQVHSQSPSGKDGGNLGEFEIRGRVDEGISRVAFSTKPGEVSEPFRTRFGVHLVQNHARIPGQLSLEDAREEILTRLSKRLWEEQVQLLRKDAKIVLIEGEKP